MNEQIHSCQITVVNPQGLHARAADLFVRLAGKYQAKIVVVKGNERVDGKGIWDLLTLGAQQGTELRLEAIGEDAEAALEALATLVRGGFAGHES